MYTLVLPPYVKSFLDQSGKIISNPAKSLSTVCSVREVRLTSALRAKLSSIPHAAVVGFRPGWGSSLFSTCVCWANCGAGEKVRPGRALFQWVMRGRESHSLRHLSSASHCNRRVCVDRAARRPISCSQTEVGLFDMSCHLAGR